MSLESSIRQQKAKNKALKDKGEPQKVYNLIKEYNHAEMPRGEAVSKCAKCGKEFEQIYSPDRNSYSSFKICQSCRSKVSNEKMAKLQKKEREINRATLPYTPFPWQEEAHAAFETHRFQVLDCGNRSGKDRYTIMAAIKYFVECLNENRIIDHPDMVPPVLWWQLAPTEKMAKQNWRELCQYFPKEWVVAKSDSNFQMETVGGGIIEVRSGYDPDSLVGVGLDLVTITEAARFKDLGLAWANLEARLNSPGRGRAIDRSGKKYGQGKAIINSSPIGKNEFYHLFCYGQKDHPDYSSLWWSKQLPWTCNPINDELAHTIVKTKYGEMTYEESLRRQIGDRTFRSNYLADFLAEDGSVFKKFEENCVVNPYAMDFNDPGERKNFMTKWKEVDPYASYCGGYDPATGSSGDSPCFVIRNKDTNNIVRVFDLHGKNYEAQYDFIAEMCKMYNYAPLYWLRTGHTAVEGNFAKRGVTEMPLDEQGQNKQKLVQTLELVVENGDLHVLMDGSAEVQTLIYQMNDYTEKNGKYSNNEQPHDDFVSALYAAFSDYSVAEIQPVYSGLLGSF